VTVLVKQLETGAERALVSDEHGRYTVLNLSPGPYKVTAQLSGFRSVVRDQLTVAIGKDLLVDIEMVVGGLEEQVTVTGETSNVSLGSTTAGGVVTTKQIAELPLNGRSFMQLATLQPGVITSRGTAKDFTGGIGDPPPGVWGGPPPRAAAAVTAPHPPAPSAHSPHAASSA